MYHFGLQPAVSYLKEWSTKILFCFLMVVKSIKKQNLNSGLLSIQSVNSYIIKPHVNPHHNYYSKQFTLGREIC